MSTSHERIWTNCLQTIEKNVNPQSFKTWFAPIKPVKLEDSALTIQVPNRFFYEWLEEHYVGLLKMTIKQELGKQGKLEYQILRRNGRPQGSKPEMSTTAPPEEMPVNPFVIPGLKKQKIDSRLNSNYVFDNYIEGDCNRLARSAGMAVARKPGGTSFNPLVVFGDTGLGKTHLIQAIGNEILTNIPNKTVLYVVAEEFTNQFIESLRNNATNDFVNFYQQIDVLIVDDIQFLANKHKTQEIFFHIFNLLHQSGKQIILSSDRAPKDLNGMEERLISRFKWGLSADISVPDLETRIAIMEYKMLKEGFDIPSDVLEFICFNIKNNIRELEGVLTSLVAQSSLNQREVDVNLAKEVIKNFVSTMSREITVEFIQELVAEHFKVSVDCLQGKTRKRTIVLARQLSMYLAKKMTSQSLKTIGENFGGRDHSTVIYSINAVQDLLDTEPMLKGTVEELEKKIKLSLNA